MKRRNFIKILCSLPFVGKAYKPNRLEDMNPGPHPVPVKLNHAQQMIICKKRQMGFNNQIMAFRHIEGKTWIATKPDAERRVYESIGTA